jgi:hypothetical protein
MKTKSVELNEFESDMILKFVAQQKNAPVSPGLCRAIYRRLEGKPAFAREQIATRRKEPVSTVTPIITKG